MNNVIRGLTLNKNENIVNSDESNPWSNWFLGPRTLSMERSKTPPSKAPGEPDAFTLAVVKSVLEKTLGAKVKEGPQFEKMKSVIAAKIQADPSHRKKLQNYRNKLDAYLKFCGILSRFNQS